MTIVDSDVARQRSTVQLVKDLTHQATTLVHQEIELVKVELNENLELAKAELADKGKKAGAGVAVLTAAGVAGLLALGTFTAFLVLALDGVMPNWAAALCVAALWALVAVPLGAVRPQQDPGSGHARARKDNRIGEGGRGMAHTSDQLKSEIGQTREQLSETADALAYKADVPTRTKDWIGEKKDAVVSTVSGVTSKAGEITPDGAEVSQSMNRMKRLAERNPVGLAIGGAAVGFIAGLLMPSTRMEDERIGPMADDVKATAADAGREALERGKDVVQEAGATAIETAKERGREEGEELSESLQEKARELSPKEAPTSRRDS